MSAAALASVLRHPTADDVGKMLLVVFGDKVRIVKMASFEGICVSETPDEEAWIWEAFEAQSCFVLPEVPGLNVAEAETLRLRTAMAAIAALETEEPEDDVDLFGISGDEGYEYGVQFGEKAGRFEAAELARKGLGS